LKVSLQAEIVTVARELHRLGLVTGTAGNVSVRDGELIHLTPRALPYRDMTEEDLVTLSPEGAVVGGTREPSSERRVHLAIYRDRPDVSAVVHTHSVHATAWSFLDEPLDTGTEELREVAGGAVRTADDAPSGTDALATAAVEALRDRFAALLPRHGVVGLGASPRAALEVCILVEHQAELAWLLRQR
jgi:ribulose-5-phosphate 4-epimerase/fuculose-1-phosphate aldolase